MASSRLCYTDEAMTVEFDEAKRLKTLKERGLDFRDAAGFFDGVWLEIRDDRMDYGEERFVSYGQLKNRDVAIVWAWRNSTRRIISMRHVHAEELENRRRALD